ncbi:nitrite reductase [Shewanella sp. Choline-02u-19]|uniref:cytochrome c3 family protein n=1 Tax=unclassified Shewanella TaxID=196818 RepID=UPI000C343B41|nr:MULTISPECIES: cytochrome c3 family protein [unclassified Shewanella]PKH56632.1 nitrite reductase [Shewanella sp. Bg11-22]PKI30183.1 nitrite reductase [Shewanella sp. Choline-02u-19]
MSITNRYGVVLLYIVWFVLLWVSFPSSALAKDAGTVANSACLKCHKRNGQMLGLHANQGLALTCEDCHGEKGKHPRKGASIIAFGAKSDTAIKTQAQQCLACHEHQQLATVHWTHNVHAKRVSCGQCHQLHPETDPALLLSGPALNQSCAKCHRAEI